MNLARWPETLVLCAAAACAQGTPKEADWPAAGVLLAPATRPGDFLDRQRIVANYKGRAAAFDAVLQKKGNELTLVGLTPFGSRAFVIRQVGTVLAFESFVPQTLPFPPSYIVVDVERVFFPWTDAPPPTDGERRFSRDAEAVAERWEGGKLRRRTFAFAEGHPPGEIVIDYDGGMETGGAPPPHVSFDNGQYGYHLDITTLTHQPL